jgi:hypothetical protein
LDSVCLCVFTNVYTLFRKHVGIDFKEDNYLPSNKDYKMIIKGC